MKISALSWIELLLLGLLWGGSFLAAEYALEEVGALWLAAHRVTWAALALWILIIVTGRLRLCNWRLCLPLLVMGILNNAIPFSLIFWGQKSIESSLAAIFNASTALFGVILCPLFLNEEQLSLRKSVGVLIGMAGVIIALGVQSLGSFDYRSFGQLAVVFAAISYALASIWGRMFLTSTDGMITAAGMLSAASLMMICLALMIDGPPRLNLQPVSWLSIFYLSLLATALAYLLYFRILARAGASNLTLVTLIIPPIAILLGHLFRDERLAIADIAGLLLIMGGLIIINGRILGFEFAKTERREK